jgi:hypothetical protein
MFDSICVRRQNLLGAPIDLGFLAEAMIFYGQVHVVADRGMMTYLLRTCGPDSLKAALSEGLLTISFLENMLGVQTETDGLGSKHHRLRFVSSPSLTLETYVERELFEQTGRRGNSRRIAKSLGKLIAKLTIGVPEAQAAANDIYDEAFCGAAAEAVLNHIAPGYKLPKAPFFRVVPRDDLLTVETNFDLGEADHYYRRLIPDAQPLAHEKILIDISRLSCMTTGAEKLRIFSLLPPTRAIFRSRYITAKAPARRRPGIVSTISTKCAARW